MKTIFKSIVVSLLVLLIQSFSSSRIFDEAESNSIFTSLDSKIASINTMQFTLVNHERIGDRMMKGKQKVSLITQPFQCHIVLIEPGSGEELVYSGAKYNNFAIYDPNGFPYVQLELDPHGSLMRKNNHHTIFDLGFGKMMAILKYHMKNASYTLKVEEVKINGEDVQKLSVEFVDFSYKRVSIDKKQTLSAFADSKMLNDYMLFELNKIPISDQLKVGSSIVIPSAYAKKIELYISKESGYPISQLIYDDKGLYEKYEFSDLVINFPIPEKRFNSENLGKSL